MIKLESFIEKCTGCSACQNACPNGSIVMKRDGCGFLYPSINEATCINCHQCERVCEALNGCNELFLDNLNSKYIAAWANEANMEPNSTSGGVATVLSKNFLESGRVFGAAFIDGVTNLQHIECSSLGDVLAISGSKYLQSDTATSFSNVKKALVSGEKVLYIGTPCQIAGLKKFLGKQYKNLYTIDFFCHGVPSPLAWEKYVDYLEKKYHAKLLKYNFRAKLRGWGRIEQSAKFSSRRFFRDIGSLNAYHSWFGHHLSIRSSCFHCQLRSDRRVSDITLADFWKIEQFYPEVPTKQGVSCVILNTKQGEELFDEAVKKCQLISKVVSYESVWEKRKTTKSNFKEPLEREEFLQNLKTVSGEQLVKKYPSQTFWQLVLSKFKSLLRK